MTDPRSPARHHPGPETSGATEVAPGVYVGGAGDARGFGGRRVCVRDDPPAKTGPDDLHLPVFDVARGRANRANLDRIAALIEEGRASGQPVLVYCGFGQRRGPLAVAWYLARHERIDLEEAYRRIRKVRPEVETPREWISDESSYSLSPLE